MASKNDWVANCKPDRVERIRAASVFLLQVGPPCPNQLQTMEGLLSEGVVGLYRVGRKDQGAVRGDQAKYLAQSDFAPSPEALRNLLGPLAPDRSR
ncbi:MAG: hypothetical protein ACOZHQ_07695 [Thermodesulfobacteriota bacterium]